MKKRVLSFILAAAVLFISVPGAAAERPVTDQQKLAGNTKILAEYPSLGEIYKDCFLISMPFNSTFAADPYFQVVKQHYSAVWMGNIMKPAMLSPAKGVYNFTEADRVAKIARDAGIELNGHTLIWHEAHAKWLTNKTDGTLLTRAEALQNMKDFINAVAGHYAGTVYAWDVLNEGMRDFWGRKYDGDWRGNLRQDGSDGSYGSPWYMAFANGAVNGESGADYVETAFRLARDADPDAILYYNDYSLEEQNKAAAVADMVKEINDKWLAEGNERLLIEGVGIQGYFCIDSDLGEIEQSINRFIDIGVEVSITEMELGLFGTAGGRNGDWALSPTPELYEKQAEVYAKIFMLFKKYSQHIRRVNCSGIYLPNNWTAQNFATIFDENCAPKLAYFAVADPEAYLAGNFDTEEKRQAWVKNFPFNPNAIETADIWARGGITQAVERGFVPEDLQNNYKNPITRAEFCRLAVKWVECTLGQNIDEIVALRGLPGRTGHTFSDTTDANIMAAYRLGITGGTVAPEEGVPGLFNPGGSITRQEAAVMVTSACRTAGADTSNPPAAGFSDMSKVSDWALGGVNFAGANNIMSGTGGGFNPGGTYTRQESIVTFNNIEYGELPKA